MNESFIEIVNWNQFQHYRDRNPPWIKLHRELLNSRTWTVSDDASRVLAIAIMMLASENDNKIPNDAAYLMRRAFLNSPPDLMPLISCNFIRLIGSASNTLADASSTLQNARPETETETETEKKMSTSSLAEDDTKPSELMALWNELATGVIQSIRSISSKRRAKIKTRLSEPMFRDNWPDVFRRAVASDFMRGQNSNNWTVSFDWLIENDANYVKVLEGKYDNKSQAATYSELPRI